MTSGWFVLTGGPCAGKTTLLNELARRGYRTVPEAARTYLDQELAKGRRIEDIRANEVAFQEAQIGMKIETERTLPHDEVVFFDRGIHDSVAYLERLGVSDNALLKEAVAHARYDAAFLLDRLPYVKDAVRTETPEEVEDIHERLAKAYTDAGIPVIRVPLMKTEKRADFVLEKIAAL